MKTIEHILKPKGYFAVDSFDSQGNLIEDTYEENNLIMDEARYNIATGISGFSGGNPITKIVFGTQGNITGDVTTPKGASDGFVSSRTSLFSEQNGGFTYTINFVPTASGELATVTEDNAGAGSTVKITLTGTTITYVVQMAQNAGNNGSSVNYTEAAFYCNDKIFSAKCFPVRVKDSGVVLQVQWSFAF